MVMRLSGFQLLQTLLVATRPPDLATHRGGPARVAIAIGTKTLCARPDLGCHTAAGTPVPSSFDIKCLLLGVM